MANRLRRVIEGHLFPGPGLDPFAPLFEDGVNDCNTDAARVDPITVEADCHRQESEEVQHLGSAHAADGSNDSCCVCVLGPTKKRSSNHCTEQSKAGGDFQFAHYHDERALFIKGLRHTHTLRWAVSRKSYMLEQDATNGHKSSKTRTIKPGPGAAAMHRHR